MMKGSPALNTLLVVAVVAIVGVAAWLQSDSDATSSDPTPVTKHEAGQTSEEKQSPPSTEADARAVPPATVKSAAPEKALPRMIDLGADKCIPCKKMAPILEEVKAEWKGRAIVQFIDVWKNPGASKKYGVRLIPTQIFFDRSGKEVHRHEGFLAKDAIVKQLKRLTVEE